MSTARSTTCRSPARGFSKPDAGGRAIEIVSPIDGIVLKRMRESEAVVPGGRTAHRGRQLRSPGGRRRPVVDRRRPGAAERSRPDRTMGRRPHARGPRAPRRAFRLHESLRARRRGATRERHHRFRRSSRPRPWRSETAYRVEVRIVVWEEPDVLKVPVGSLFRRGDEWAVFVIDDGRARTQRRGTGPAQRHRSAGDRRPRSRAPDRPSPARYAAGRRARHRAGCLLSPRYHAHCDPPQRMPLRLEQQRNSWDRQGRRRTTMQRRDASRIRAGDGDRMRRYLQESDGAQDVSGTRREFPPPVDDRRRLTIPTADADTPDNGLPRTVEQDRYRASHPDDASRADPPETVADVGARLLSHPMRP